MGKFGTMEIAMILGVALLIFGPSKLPQIGKSLGQTVFSFKKGMKDITEISLDDNDSEKSDKKDC